MANELVIRNGLKINIAPSDGTGDPLLTRDSTSGIVGSIPSALSAALNSGQILVGNSSNIATPVTPSGDITISDTGVTSIGAGVIVNADINASASIALSKLASLTATRALVSDGSGFVSASSVTSTELGYLSGVTSGLQTQLNAKQATITGGATTITSLDLTADRALISSGTGKVAVSSVTNTELSFVSGVTSAIQTQIDSKQATLVAGTQGDILYHDGSAWTRLARGTNGQALYSTASSIQWDTPTINGIPIGGSTNQVLAKQSGTDFDSDWETITLSFIPEITATAAELNILGGATLTTTELNYVDGVTSNIQTQLDSKQSSSLPQNAIWVGNSSGLASALSSGTSGYVLTSVAGVPTWQPVSAGSTPGSDTQVLFNDAGSFGADAGMTYNKTDNILTVGRLVGIPTATFPAINVGTLAGTPSTRVEGDIWLNTSGDNRLTAVIDGIDKIIVTTTGLGVAGLIGFSSTSSPGSTLTTDTALSWDSTNDALTVGVARIFTINKTIDDLYIGEGAGNFTTTGIGANIGIGKNTLTSLTTAVQNVAVGHTAGDSLTTGGFNTLIGHAAGESLTTGNSNVLIGAGTASTLTGSNNILIGTDIEAQVDGNNGQLSIANAIFGTGNTATGTTASTGKIGILAPAPNSTLHVAGSFTLPYVAKSSAYTASDTDYCINCTSGSFTISLPTAVGIAGRMYVIKNSTGGGTITIDPSGAETIDGLASTTVVGSQSNIIMSTGANWIILDS